MPKYCCFNCPEKGHDDTRELDHNCPNCNQAYGFPLVFSPDRIDRYEVIEPISRGFYGATYVVKDEMLDSEFVIKIIPKSIYTLHEKDFVQECQDHAQLAKGSQHIVGINSMGEAKVIFKNDQEVHCHFQVLDYIPGSVLKKVLESEEKISSIKVAQIAIDLFRILDVLINSGFVSSYFPFGKKRKTTMTYTPRTLLFRSYPEKIEERMKLIII